MKKKELIQVLKKRVRGVVARKTVNAPKITRFKVHNAEQQGNGCWLWGYATFTVKDTYTFLGERRVDVYEARFDGDLEMVEVAKA